MLPAVPPSFVIIVFFIYKHDNNLYERNKINILSFAAISGQPFWLTFYSVKIVRGDFRHLMINLLFLYLYLLLEC